MTVCLATQCMFAFKLQVTSYNNRLCSQSNYKKQLQSYGFVKIPFIHNSVYLLYLILTAPSPQATASFWCGSNFIHPVI